MSGRASWIVALIGLAACGGALGRPPEDLGLVALTDPRLAPFADMRAVDRAAHGLSALPDSARVGVELREGADAQRVGYDAMLHLGGGCSSRTVTFRRDGDHYRWIGEQEVIYGPREYNADPDERMTRKSVAISYNAEAYAGAPAGLVVSYGGPDPMPKYPFTTLEHVRPLLSKWGCPRAPDA